jgi:hypothetical protein
MPSVKRSIAAHGVIGQVDAAAVMWGHHHRSPIRSTTAAVLCGMAWA